MHQPAPRSERDVRRKRFRRVRSAALAGVLAALWAADAAAQRQRAAPGTWTERCASCHGTTGANGSAPSLLDGAWRGDGSDAALAAAIAHGAGDGAMPAFAGMLDDEQIRALVVYVRELRSRHQRGDRDGGNVSGRTEYEAGGQRFRVETAVDGLEVPWSIAFLPDGGWLVVERAGRLRLVRDGKLDPRPIEGTPAVLAEGQGGLLDVALHPEHATNGWIYLAFSDPREDETGRTVAMTAVVRGRIRDHRWTDEEVVYRAPASSYLPTRHHYGTRLAFDGAGHLFFSIGDRGRQADAQDLAKPNGKIHRLRDDGSVPDDNPFVGRSGALPSIWSYGHRNPQGIAFQPGTGELYASEHGPRGGDELNRIIRGANYGWPVVTHGMNYDGTPISARTQAPGMTDPVTQWTPSIAVIGIDFYAGERFASWRGDLLVSAIASGQLRRLRVAGDRVMLDELLLDDQGHLRDVATAPDGTIVVLTSQGRIVRIVPREASTL